MKTAATILAMGSFALLSAVPATASSRDAATWTANLSSEYAVSLGITYLTASNLELKLDVYAPRGISTPNPTVVYFHGGGWEGGSRDRVVLSLLPYLEMGLTVINVDYRGSQVSLAPAAVEDCRCALLWVVRSARSYNVDVDRIVLTGDSAGGHLALIAGMLPAAAGLDRPCPSATGQEPKAAAVVNWFGAADVAGLLEGPDAQGFAIRWFGSRPDRAELARRLSPLTYARPAAPPVLTVHGDADRVVPIAQARRLHEELTRHAVPNELVTVPGGGHGGFPREQNERIYTAIRAFLVRVGVVKPRS